MLFHLLSWSILSLSLIILLHYLYIYFIDTLTVPKVKDLISQPLEQYQQIVNDEELQNNAKQEIKEEIDDASMQNELTNFLNNIKENKISTIDSLEQEKYSLY